MIRTTCYKAKAGAGTHADDDQVEKEYREYTTWDEAYEALKTHSCAHEIKLK